MYLLMSCADFLDHPCPYSFNFLFSLFRIKKISNTHWDFVLILSLMTNDWNTIDKATFTPWTLRKGPENYVNEWCGDFFNYRKSRGLVYFYFFSHFPSPFFLFIQFYCKAYFWSPTTVEVEKLFAAFYLQLFIAAFYQQRKEETLYL